MRKRLIPLLALLVLLPSRAALCQERGGFTLLLTLGYGLQSGGIGEGTSDGLGGLNLGIGGFVSEDTALMFRISGTNVSYQYDAMYDQPRIGGSQSMYKEDVVSGVAVFDVQYWPTSRLNLEIGGGFGFVSSDYLYDERGVGLLGAMGYTVLLRGKYSLQLGVEYAPVVLGGGTINNLGFNVGFQFL
ncbi:MAG: hypothetical protein OEX18_14840 [Candidatus Krumholzibacteria bacterium]|nr:hypothetical protein [Candidatus Krumholzibacteria bacterium]MDH4338545.1 hypothetical protein [Candidatus Krumholzibacteria bacterium]MDH5269248.1 hypothetical protein [Candidatus Krumholzibacteria bacterium]MDH5626965.1 hypothetical protein [Candidatus Krumholzibacteria bacterium]